MKLILFIISCFLACSPSQTGPVNNAFQVQNAGQIRLVDSSNQTYAIYTKDGKRYLPLNLKKRFQRDGLQVLFEGTIDTSRLKNVRLAGLPIWLKKIKLQQ
jgi:hypothetical protein